MISVNLRNTIGCFNMGLIILFTLCWPRSFLVIIAEILIAGVGGYLLGMVLEYQIHEDMTSAPETFDVPLPTSPESETTVHEEES